MITGTDISSTLALDARAIDKLKFQAKTDPKEAIRATAQQFEALFISMMLKSMRDATPEDGMFDSDQSKLYTSMMDQQMAQKMSSGKGLGLAELMVRQLTQDQAASLQTKAQANDPKVLTDIAVN